MADAAEAVDEGIDDRSRGASEAVGNEADATGIALSTQVVKRASDRRLPFSRNEPAACQYRMPWPLSVAEPAEARGNAG
jgi:hypothetical protein